MNRKFINIILGIVFVAFLIFVIQVVSGSNNKDYNLSNSNIVILRTQLSPNEKYQFYEYQFDNGGLGFSRVFWSVIEIKDFNDNLYNGLFPNGYKILDWTPENELQLEKWLPYYLNRNERIETLNSDFNGVKIKILE